jgi:plasmid maintenance system antidote protein VapI
MPAANSTRRKAATSTKRRTAAAPQVRKATWQRPADYDEIPQPTRGRHAVQHGGEQRGRRSAKFPDLNISATADRLGITKSHLGKVLAGTSRPSAELILRLAEVLDQDANYVLSLYKSREREARRKKR